MYKNKIDNYIKQNYIKNKMKLYKRNEYIIVKNINKMGNYKNKY